MKIIFDKGTLILSRAPDLLDVSSLPGVLYDPRVGQYRAPAWRIDELRRVLGHREIAIDFEGWPSRGLSEPWHRIPLRPYQQDALSAWDSAGRRGVVALPTGSGKTRVAMAAAAANRCTTLFLVPTRVLLHQWAREIKKVFGGPVGCLGDTYRSVQAVTVSTFESAVRWMPRIGDRFALLVVDEVHHLGMGARFETLEMSAATMRLGLTATPVTEPERADSLRVLVGPTVFQLSADDLVGQYLAHYEVIILEIDLSAEERALYRRETALFRTTHRAFCRLNPDSDWAAFVRAASRTEQGRRALAAWRRSRSMLGYTAAKAELLTDLLERNRQSRVLIFTPDNQTAYAVARRHLVMPITCDIGAAERDRALQWFREGRIRTLVSSRVLNEGLDVPDADVAIIVGGTLGAREHTQRIGRLLRPREGKRARVYELVCRNTGEVYQAQRRRCDLGTAFTQQAATGRVAGLKHRATLFE